MGKLSLETLVDLAKFYNPIFLDAPLSSWVKCNDENSLLYKAVYGDSESHHGAILPYVKKGSNVIELFGGNAFESYLLSKEVSANYYSLDLETIKRHQKKPGILYVTGNALELENSTFGTFDTVFIGGANASLCCLRPDQIPKLFESVANIQKKGGVFVLGLFSDQMETPDLDISYEEKQIAFVDDFKGYKRHQLILCKKDPFVSSHQYFHAVLLTHKKKAPFYLYNTDAFIYYSHTVEYILRSAKEFGYSLYNFSVEHGSRAIVLKKD